MPKTCYAIQHVANHRGVTITTLSRAVEGYGAVAQARWAAWRRKNDLQDMSRDALDDQLAEICQFLDPIFLGTASDQGRWDPGTQVWTVDG